MSISRSRLLLAGVLAGLLAASGCQAKKKTVERPRPRPVRVAVLKVTDPTRALRLTGSAASWKQQDVAFEVSGRVAFIVDNATNLEGRWEEDGKVRVEGQVLARLDPQDYEISKAQAQAYHVVTQRKLEAAQVELEHVLPAQLAATAAELERATAEYDKNKKAFETKAVSELDVIRTKASRDASKARNEEAKANIETKKADIEALKADVERARQDLINAEFDLTRCKLYAPFDAEVSEIQIEAGGYARRGEAVAHLVMMDPIKIDLALSRDTMQQLQRGDSVRIFLPGRSGPAWFAKVFEKATVADPETRTFRVSLLTRNIRDIGLPVDSPLRKLPVIENFAFLQLVSANDPAKGFVIEERRSLRKDDGGHYVWAAPAVKLGDRIDPKRPVVKLKKFYVKPTAQQMNLQGIYLGRVLSDIGKLEPGMLVPMDVPTDFADGGEVLLAQRHWLLKPGQLIKVQLGADLPDPGLFVPAGAIRPGEPKSGSVFLMVDGKARQAKIRIVGSVGEAMRIEPADEAAQSLVKPGSRLILDYIHFLEDGELVSSVREEELKS